LEQIEYFPGGLRGSRLVAGVWRMHEWQFSLESRLHWIHSCLAHGIDTFDHADLYGMHTVESLFGEALAASPGLRDQMVLVSKCGIRLTNTEAAGLTRAKVKHYDTSAVHITRSVENSLRALRTDRLDLLLIHRPDPLLEADSIALTFARLQQSGKVRYFGVSNHAPHELDLVHERLREVGLVVATNQIEASLLCTRSIDDGTLSQAQRLRFRPMAWSPLAGGGLMAQPAVAAVLKQIATDRGATPEQIAIAWLLRHPAGIIPVLGTRNTDRIAALAKAPAFGLTREEWFELYAAARGHEVP
jgi:predicted oxidoreductase